MTHYFLGIDTGATKSHALIANETGRTVGFAKAGPGNWETIGWDGLQDVLHTITNRVLASAGITKSQIAGAGFGLAGYDWPEDREPTLRVIETLGLDAPYELVNDTIIGLLAGATENWGVVVAAGTSNNCRGRNRQGQEGRVTGMGEWFGEYGGAGELVTKAIHAIVMAWTHRGPATRLTEAFVRQAGATDITDLLAGLSRNRYELSAADAPLIFQMAAEGDQVAQDIIAWAGRELGGLANGVIRQLGFEDQDFEVVLSGSLYNSESALIDSLASTIYAVAPKAKIVHLHAPPVVGGVVLGMLQVGLDTKTIRPKLIESTKALLK